MAKQRGEHPPTLSKSEWMEVLGDVYRNGVADGRREAYLEQISGTERICLGGTLRHASHEALEDAAAATESLWSEHPAQFDRISTGLGPGIWEVRGTPSPIEASEESEGEELDSFDPPASPTVQLTKLPGQ